MLKFLKFILWQYWRIPKGCYCYRYLRWYEKLFIEKNKYATRQIKRCPYWDLLNDKPKQMNGYCHFLKAGDFQLEEEKILINMKTGEKYKGNELPFSTSLLWDSIKECGIKEYYE